MLVKNVMTVYGKNKQYVNSHWVMENAIEEYKAKEVFNLRTKGWRKEITFIETMEPYTTWDEKGYYGTILAYTTEGFKTVKVN